MGLLYLRRMINICIRCTIILLTLGVSTILRPEKCETKVDKFRMFLSNGAIIASAMWLVSFIVFIMTNQKIDPLIKLIQILGFSTSNINGIMKDIFLDIGLFTVGVYLISIAVRKSLAYLDNHTKPLDNLNLKKGLTFWTKTLEEMTGLLILIFDTLLFLHIDICALLYITELFG